MTERVYIHIGAPKTGTTYLQKVMARNRAAMRENGVLYPKISGPAHHTAQWDLRRAWELRAFAIDIRGHWDKLVRQVSRWTGPTAVLSSEMLVYAEEHEVDAVLASFDGHEPHIVYTARDLVRQVPAYWQQQLRKRSTQPYDVFVSDVLGAVRTDPAQAFFRAQDAATALRRWSRGVDPAHVHVVTMPPSGAPPDVLWRRFAGVIGLDGADYSVDVPPANTSMSVLEAEVLRRFNIRHGKDFTNLRYRQVVRGGGLFKALDEVVTEKSKITLTADEHNALVARSEQLAEELERAGYDIAGNISDLVPATVADPAEPAERPEDVTDDEVVDPLLDVLFVLLNNKSEASSAGAESALDPGSELDED